MRGSATGSAIPGDGQPDSDGKESDIIEIDASDLEPTASGSYNIAGELFGAVNAGLRIKNVIGALAPGRVPGKTGS